VILLHRVINIAEAEKLINPIYIDMRSPSEYAMGHIPQSVNIPLFTDAERAEVGTIYKQIGMEDAKQLGLTIVSAKLPELVGQIRKLAKSDRTVLIYCWRGGMRSKSVVSILDVMGIPAFQLLGGYKAYRNHVLDSLRNFNLKPQIIVLCGSTGVGKTQLLALLKEKGEPVIDLENLANHRGSAFGHVGKGLPATAQNFDAAILSELKRVNDQPYILVECESKRVGNVYIPDVLFKAMQTGKKILAQANIETRVSRLLQEYTGTQNQNHVAIINSIQILQKKLGHKRVETLLAQMNSGQLDDVVRSLLVDYYDPLYGYEKINLSAFDLVVSAENLTDAASRMIDYLNCLRR
jgi:tRNA 2-selenouridine synthase